MKDKCWSGISKLIKDKGLGKIKCNGMNNTHNREREGSRNGDRERERETEREE